MKCSKIIEILENLAPSSYACSWDNPGLIAGSYDAEIHKILIALDATDKIIDLAIAQGADLIVTHHPMIFSSMKKVNDCDFNGRKLIKLIRHDICCYAMHTNFDVAPGCMADLCADLIGLKNGAPLEETGEVDGRKIGIGKTGYLKNRLTVKQIAALVKDKFQLPFVTVYGEEEIKEPIDYIAVSPGSGKSMIESAVKSKVKVLCTGDIGHHEGLDAAQSGLCIIDAGHYGLEHVFIDFMTRYCERELKLEVIKAPIEFPVHVY